MTGLTLTKFCKCLAEFSRFSDYGVVYSKAILSTKYVYLENRLSKDHVRHTIWEHDADDPIHFL